MKSGVIKQLTGQHSVRKLCRTLDVTRSAHYAAAKKPARPRGIAEIYLRVPPVTFQGIVQQRGPIRLHDSATVD